MCLQLKMYCTLGRTKKIVIGSLLFSLAVTFINFILFHRANTAILNHILATLFLMVIPATVLVINAVVVHQVRRSSSNPELHHQQSVTSSSNSAPIEGFSTNFYPVPR